ncbi:hypothetical protein JCM10213_001672 [Rhodosporidiobolus nylandii]
MAFPPPPAGSAAARARAPLLASRSGLSALQRDDAMLDILELTASHPMGNPDARPGPPKKASYFPSVPRVQREKARAARLGSEEPLPQPPSAASLEGLAGIATAQLQAEERADEGDEADHGTRERRAKVQLAASGPFDNRRPFAASIHSLVHAAGAPFPPPPASVTASEKSVGNGGSGGTKRRHRETERKDWDAASELVRLEREDSAHGRSAGGDGESEKTPTPSVAASFSAQPPAAGADVEMSSGAWGKSTSLSPHPEEQRPSAPPSVLSGTSIREGEDEDGDDAMTLDEDDASVRSGASKATGASGSGKEPAKKRSRTLTTPAQTAVLNALLAKTRFPSTETREEVGKQIGMSARRVQIWFQNRRQSQKRLRDREAQEAAAAAAGHPLHPHPHQPVYQHPYAAHAHIDPYTNQAAHFYPLKPKQHVPASPYAHLPHPPAASRPELLHRASMDSLASRASLASAAQSQHSLHSSHAALSSYSSERDGLGPLPSEAHIAYGAQTGYMPYGHSQQPQQQQQHFTHLGQPVHTLQHSQSHAHLGRQRSIPHSLSIPSKLYFPHVPRANTHAPPGRVQAEPFSSTAGTASPSPGRAAAGEAYKLPSLSSILSPASGTAAPPPVPPKPVARAVPVDHEPMFSHSPFSPVPAAATLPTPPPPPQPVQPILASAPAPLPPVLPAPPLPAFNRSFFSPEPSASSFEKLSISGGPLSPTPSTSAVAGPLSPLSPGGATTTTPPTSVTPAPASEGSASPLDILDVAVETMAYRPSGRHLPARQMLPPLRSVLGDAASGTAKRPLKGGKSEADQALLAPILSSSSSASSPSVPPRLAPISTFAPLGGPSPPLSSALSPLSPASAPMNPNQSFRTSTWSEQSHGTSATKSTADFEFAHPPVGSYRSGAAAWGTTVLGGGGGGRERGGSGSVPGSARTSVSSEMGIAK